MCRVLSSTLFPEGEHYEPAKRRGTVRNGCFRLGVLASQRRQPTEVSQGSAGRNLVSFELVRPDGSKGYLFGTNPKGIHTFDPGGHFTVIFMRPDLPKISSGDQTKVTPEEAQAISTGAISVFGTYTLNEADKTLSLHIDGTTLVNLYGIPQKRLVISANEDEIKLRNPTAVGGGYIDLILKRAK
jgi:Lipocalin-like domain